LIFMSTRRPLISLTDGPRLHPFRERNQKRPRGFNQALYITHDFIRSNVPVVRIVRNGSKWRMTMTKRRAFRDGGIVARGENSWRLRYRISGKRFTKTVHGTKSEAQKALRDLLHSGDTGEHVAPDKMTLGQWIDHWVSIGCPGNKKRREVGRRSIERYAELLRCHVTPTLGKRPLQQIQATEIDALYVQLVERMSLRTAHHVHVVLGACLGRDQDAPAGKKSDAGIGESPLP
jgi:hypothetical protein